MKRKLTSRSADDILAALLITYALAAFSYEKYMPDSFMNIWNIIVFIFFAAAWTGLSFKSGYLKKSAFPIFTALFWIIPHIIIFLANDGPRVFRMSVTMYVLSEFFTLLTVVPSEITGGVLGISSPAAVIVIILLCAAGYLSGMFMAVSKRRHS